MPTNDDDLSDISITLTDASGFVLHLGNDGEESSLSLPPDPDPLDPEIMEEIKNYITFLLNEINRPVSR